MKTLTTVGLQLLMYWLLLQPSSQASLQAASGLSSSSSSSLSTKGRSAKKKTEFKNICDLKLKNPPIYCTCNKMDTYKATETDCLILDKLRPDDQIWDYLIESQPGFEIVKFIVPNTNGEMTHVPTKTLRLLKNLTRVEFRGAIVKNLVEKAFSDIPSVTSIHMTECSIVNLKKYAFGNMTKLNTINLDRNGIHEINRDVFVSLPSLKKLIISHNNLTLIHDKALKHLTSLEILDLSENKISVITNDIFTGLTSLKHLNLNGNAIEMIGDRTFVEVPQLEELLLDQNKIEFISNTALEGLRNLRKLSLSDNKLVELQTDVLSGTTSLNFLDLRNNRLRTITFEHIKPILQELYNVSSHLYLEDNQFICDCKLAWIFGVRNETSNKNLKDSLGSLTCFLESQNASSDGYGVIVDNNETGVEVKRDSGESYSVSKVKNPEYEGEDEDVEDGAGDEDYEEHPNSTVKIEKEKLETVNGKSGYFRQIADLKYDDLPCPEQGPLGSEQSSSRQENMPIVTGVASTAQHHCTLLAALTTIALQLLL